MVVWPHLDGDPKSLTIPDFRMPRLPQVRIGQPVEIRDRSLAFSYWPMYKGATRYGLQSNIFATNPWAIIRGSIRERCSAASAPEARAAALQAEEFFRAGVEAELWAAKPLLLYYSFMNLAKALMLTAGSVDTFNQARHGASEKLRPGNRELLDAFLRVYKSPDKSGARNLFADFASAFGSRVSRTTCDYDITILLPQVVAGHRLWCAAANKRERFVSIDKIEFVQDESAKQLWMRLNIFADDLARLGVSHSRLLGEASLNKDWREITPDFDMVTDRKILRFEQRQSIGYTHRPSDKIPTIVDGFRQSLWSTVTSVPPYRKYYLYLAPQSEGQQVLPQLVSIYALTYYFSSIARYRPQHFEDIIGGKFGEQIQEFLTNQPNQFLYLIASEFAQRDVTRAAIV